jgi:hypothetical protein
MNAIPPHEPDDTDMTGTYVKVILVEAAILIALFVFGRLYS